MEAPAVRCLYRFFLRPIGLVGYPVQNNGSYVSSASITSKGSEMTPSGAGGITSVGVEELLDWTIEFVRARTISFNALPGLTPCSAINAAVVAILRIVSASALSTPNVTMFGACGFSVLSVNSL